MDVLSVYENNGAVSTQAREKKTIQEAVLIALKDHRTGNRSVQVTCEMIVSHAIRGKSDTQTCIDGANALVNGIRGANAKGLVEWFTRAGMVKGDEGFATMSLSQAEKAFAELRKPENHWYELKPQNPWDGFNLVEELEKLYNRSGKMQEKGAKLGEEDKVVIPEGGRADLRAFIDTVKAS